MLTERHLRQLRQRIKITCRKCKKVFSVYPARTRRKSPVQFCSRACRVTKKRLNCLRCEKEFYSHVYRPYEGRFCSRKCTYASMLKNKRVGYRALHEWLERKFGKADKCQNKYCTYSNPKRYHWAKLHRKQYIRKRRNFITLCVSCHYKYDRSRSQILI